MLNGISSTIGALNPLNWDPKTQRKIVQVCAVSVAAFCVLDLIQRWPSVAALTASDCAILHDKLDRVPFWININFKYDCSLDLKQNTQIANELRKGCYQMMQDCRMPQELYNAIVVQMRKHLQDFSNDSQWINEAAQQLNKKMGL